MFRKSRVVRWRDMALAIGLLLIGGRMVSAAFQAHGHETLCLILQIAACAVLLAAGGLSLFLLSSPTLYIDKFGVGEKGFLLSDLNWSMTWNEIAYAVLVGEVRGRLQLVGLDTDEIEHTLSGYERFESALDKIREGLKKYGRRLIETGDSLPFERTNQSP